jgi:hypothetical protein
MKYLFLLSLGLATNLAFSQSNLLTGLQACYPLDCDNAVNNVVANTPLLNGSANNVICTTGHTGLPNTAYQFGGNSSSYISLPANTLLKPSLISVSGWFKLDNLNSTYLVYTSNGCGVNQEAYSLGVSSAGFAIARVTTACFPQPILTSGVPVNTTSWFHVAFYMDSLVMKLYVNGNLVSMPNAANWGYVFGKPVILGSSQESFDAPFMGKMDNLRFYNRELTAAEVNLLYIKEPACTASGTTADLKNNGFISGSSVMSQNVPNPFTNETTIQYSIPSIVTNASIEVYDLIGKKMGTYPLLIKGESSLKITSDKLAAGMYIYSIIGDGKVMESKRMIVTH